MLKSKGAIKKYKVLQVDSTDCGPACLATVLTYWSRKEPLYRLRDLAGTTQSGTLQACKALNLESDAYNADVEGLQQLSLPVILLWEPQYFL